MANIGRASDPLQELSELTEAQQLIHDAMMEELGISRRAALRKSAYLHHPLPRDVGKGCLYIT